MAANSAGITVTPALTGSSKPIFAWFPDEGSTENIKPSVTSNKFGDGYEQRTTQGINSEVITWTLSFTANNTDSLPIRAFLRARGAKDAFQWVNPFGELGLYVCRDWTSSKVSPSLVKIDAKFDRVYEANV